MCANDGAWFGCRTVGRSMGSAWISSCDKSGQDPRMDGSSLGYKLMDRLNGTWLVVSSMNVLC